MAADVRDRSRKLMPVGEAADEIGVTAKTLREGCRADPQTVPGQKVCGQWMVPVAWVDWLTSWTPPEPAVRAEPLTRRKVVAA